MESFPMESRVKIIPNNLYPPVHTIWVEHTQMQLLASLRLSRRSQVQSHATPGRARKDCCMYGTPPNHYQSMNQGSDCIELAALMCVWT